MTTGMHAEGRRYVERVRRDRERNERFEIENVRLAWQGLSDRDRAIVLATYYEDVEIPAEEPRPRRRWWQL